MSDYSKLHVELQKLRDIMIKNGYPISLFDKCVKACLNRMFSERLVVSTVERQKVLLVLPYLGAMSLQLRTRLQRAISKCAPSCKLSVVFKAGRNIGIFFKFKDRPCRNLLSGVVYKFSCGCCNASYIGQTMRHLKVRASEHIGISALTGNRVQPTLTAISDHLLFCPYDASFDDFVILTTCSNSFQLELKESLLIHRDGPELNKSMSSKPLYLFN